MNWLFLLGFDFADVPQVASERARPRIASQDQVEHAKPIVNKAVNIATKLFASNLASYKARVKRWLLLMRLLMFFERSYSTQSWMKMRIKNKNP